MKRTLLAVATLALGIASAQAADIPQPSFKDYVDLGAAVQGAQAGRASTGASAARADARASLNDSFNYPSY
jgi:opacity protein-like surface antigen